MIAARFRLVLVATFGLSIIAALAWATGGPALPQDKGPAKLDVSKYPEEIQKDYKLFASKCDKCHTLARPLNTSMTEKQWSRYVKRMMHKPNSGISSKQGKAIFDFLVYDQANRKDKDPKSFYKALTDEELQKLRETQDKQETQDKKEEKDKQDKQEQ